MTDQPEIEEVRLCEVANEVEAALVVNLLQEDGISARSDATAAGSIFGGLPFESGHGVYVPADVAIRAREVLATYPHFQNLRNVHEPLSD